MLKAFGVTSDFYPPRELWIIILWPSFKNVHVRKGAYANRTSAWEILTRISVCPYGQLVTCSGNGRRVEEKSLTELEGV